ncbi:MAG: GWxTD domain-containing protein [Bryobacteraceae bacterium]|nr:GWxTD domain-containing protein [Solibacteraceae bacterium]MCL4844302.1 GWxTD domain-containing protein [Bryobacteraceae bacterium]HAX44382.1 GWxTD domain-containing protein [Bryobacterales bacterium]
MAGALVFTTGDASFAQKKKKGEQAPRETVAKPLSEKELKRREARLRKELMTPYRNWLNVDVTYIITDEERKAFGRLETDEEREQFIEQFWLRRDPTPDTVENEYKEEHYRRIAYANERFASGFPGWRSDRGRIYITFGPADEVESRPSGGTYERPWEEGGGTTSVFPFEKWRYRYIEGIGTDIMIEFVDTSMTGEYRMTMDPSEKDALMHVPGAGLTMMEQLGMADKADRFSRTDGTRLGTGTAPLPMRMQQFERLQQFAMLQKPPSVKFKDLEAQVNSRVMFNLLPMEVRADFFPATSSTVMTNITLQFNRSELQFKQEGAVSQAAVNIYARVTSMTRRPVNVFEDVVTVDVPTDLLQQASTGASIYQKSIPLQPGMYRLNVVAKDIVGGNMNNYEMALNVPRMDEDQLFASSLVLADVIEKVPTRSIGAGQFVIGTSKVRPRMGDKFKRNEKMGIYMQLFNFQPEEGTAKPKGTIEYEIVKNSDNSKVLEFSEDVAALGGSAAQMTIEKLLPLESLEAGQYTLRIKVTDTLKNETLTQQTEFTIS